MRSRFPLLVAALPALLAFAACEETPPPAVPPPPAPPPPAMSATAAPAQARPAAPAPRADATLLPRKILFGNPERLPPRISPDGKRILFIAPEDGVLNVWVGPVLPTDPKVGEGASPTSAYCAPSADRYCTWAETGKHVIYSNDKGGDENFHVFVVDLEKGQAGEGPHALRRRARR